MRVCRSLIRPPARANDIIRKRVPGRPTSSATDPLDAFAVLEAERVRVNTRLKQGIIQSERKNDINSHTLLTLWDLFVPLGLPAFQG